MSELNVNGNEKTCLAKMKDVIAKSLAKDCTNRKQADTLSVLDEAGGVGGQTSEWILCYDPRYPNRGYWYPRNTDSPE